MSCLGDLVQAEPPLKNLLLMLRLTKFFFSFFLSLKYTFSK